MNGGRCQTQPGGYSCICKENIYLQDEINFWKIKSKLIKIGTPGFTGQRCEYCDACTPNPYAIYFIFKLSVFVRILINTILDVKMEDSVFHLA